MTYHFSDARIGHLRLKARQLEGLFLRLIKKTLKRVR